jgi:hypothetical protein
MQRALRRMGLDESEKMVAVVNDFHPDFERRNKMTISWAFRIALLCVALSSYLLPAADFANYRGFQFGMSVSKAAEQAGMKASEAKTEHQRPVLIQALDFQPNLFHSSVAKDDPVSEITLSFLDGELFRMAVVYDRYKVDGMTTDDMIQALSKTYGTATKPTAEIAYHSYYAEAAPVIARWEDSQYSYNLVRAEDRSTFALVLYSKALDARAHTGMVEAARLDVLEGPQREADRVKKQTAENETLQEKSRLANKASFRP